LRSPALPVATEPRVYADVLGLTILGHRPATGWLLLALAGGLGVFTAWRARRAGELALLDLGRGALLGVWVLAAGLVLSQTARLLAGPMSQRGDAPEVYYVLLARLPWIEAGVALALLAVGLVALTHPERRQRLVTAAVIAGAAGLTTVLGGPNRVVLIAAAVAIGLSLWPQARPRSAWGGWLGLILLMLVAGGAVQTVAPGAAFLLIWPGLLTAVAAALTVLTDSRLNRSVALIPAVLATTLGGAWVVSLAHPVFLGIGMDLPAALAPLGLLILMFAYPLAPRSQAKRLAVAAAACLVLACGLSLTGRIMEPMPASAPQQ
jgi:hypothetical protein